MPGRKIRPHPRPYEPCEHEDPRGRHYCALCRRKVLAEAGQLPPPKHYRGRGVPMPLDFHDRVIAATATQPTLEDA